MIPRKPTRYPRPDGAEPTDPLSGGLMYAGANYTADELELLRAVQEYQKRHRRKYLSHVDYLRVAAGLGYRKERTP